ncbi:MAG: chromosome segregation protein SMC [Nitrospirota bacterium]
MHLQSLELFGFKSFADKTVFNFHEGVTAIVGPNGCGKSNVLDAVKWALGEQSAKSLRGDEMADVIFNGADTRKPVGFAEVSLTFTDCAEEFGIDWHDVRVTRRVYRDGNSEYLLNKTPCRLKDIQSLFADTGIARTAYSMMEQGRIDMILSSRPEDRRAVFEEAAGITKYKTQKREALRKLEATEANLLRIGDVIKEVKRQIGSLQRQAGKARRYQALHADLRVLETYHASTQLASLEADLAASRKEIERLIETEKSTRAKIDNGENSLAEERAALDKIDAEIADSRAEVQRLDSEIATHRNRIEFNRQRAQELAELMERAQRDVADAENKRNQQAVQIKQTNSSIAEIEQHLKAKEAELTELSILAGEIHKKRSDRVTRLQELQLALSKSESRISTLEEELTGTKARRELTHAQIEQLLTEIDLLAKTRDKIVDEIAVSLKAALTQPIDVETTVREKEKLLAQTEQDLATLHRTLAEKRSRLDVLRQLNEEGEGLAEGSQALLKGVDGPEKFRDAIAGSLVAQLDVDPNFIQSIEAALGRSLHAIILKDEEVVSEIIGHLKKRKLGNAALLIASLTSPAPQPPQNALPAEALAWATDKVKTPKALETLVTSLLRDVVIFPELEQALECKKREPVLAIATLAGEYISREGIVFTRSSEARAASLLERKAQIADLAKEEAALAEKCDSVSATRDEAKTALETASRLQRELSEAGRKIDSLQSERTALERQIAAADERIVHIEGGLQSVRGQLADHKTELGAFEAAQKQTVLREEELTERTNELRLGVATDRQRHENLIAQREPLNARDAELAELINLRKADIAMYERKVAAQAAESRESEKLIETQTDQRVEAEANSAKIASERVTRLAAVSDRESELRRVRDSLGELQDRRAQTQVRESQFQMKIDNLLGHISRSYQIDLRGFTADQFAFEKVLRAQVKKRANADDVGSTRASPALIGPPVDEPEHGDDQQKPFDSGLGGEEFGKGAELSTPGRVPSPEGDVPHPDVQQLISSLRTQLDNMGPVNLEAVHEYDELEERYKFLEAQNTDLTNSQRELLDVIARINSTTRKLFAETFEQVRTNFREMFGELFRGGRADLSLLDENDPLNCGIEITAKPPGKQLQSVSLLSGGERAMTAVALLFAIYMVRPSPFCILDEVDAPLDENNINCFTRVLDRFVQQSQFIIITHNKRTIAKADVLYGVTMEERGVSKLVGVKLTAQAQPVAEPASNGNAHAPRQQRLAFAAR